MLSYLVLNWICSAKRMKVSNTRHNTKPTKTGEEMIKLTKTENGERQSY
jgi:hypothetical protein